MQAYFLDLLKGCSQIFTTIAILLRFKLHDLITCGSKVVVSLGSTWVRPLTHDTWYALLQSEQQILAPRCGTRYMPNVFANPPTRKITFVLPKGSMQLHISSKRVLGWVFVCQWQIKYDTAVTFLLLKQCASLINVGGKLNNTYIPLSRSVFYKRVSKYRINEEMFRVF